MDKMYFNRLKKKCLDYGFTARGKAFFRIVGDGILQVIKCNYERNLGGELIFVGLFSLYGYLRPEWFTASGCIPRYCVTNCVYQNDMPLVFHVPIETQLHMLEDQVLPWLDSVDTQKKLIRAITKLDPRWIDSLKIGPYMACGERNHAKKVIREILSQNNFGSNCRRQYYEDSSGMLYLKEKQEGEDFYFLLEMISRDDPEEINRYLMDNYERNMSYAGFCVKNSKNS